MYQLPHLVVVMPIAITPITKQTHDSRLVTFAIQLRPLNLSESVLESVFDDAGIAMADPLPIHPKE